MVTPPAHHRRMAVDLLIHRSAAIFVRSAALIGRSVGTPSHSKINQVARGDT
jgi:hypothetical protein